MGYILFASAPTNSFFHACCFHAYVIQLTDATSNILLADATGNEIAINVGGTDSKTRIKAFDGLENRARINLTITAIEVEPESIQQR